MINRKQKIILAIISVLGISIVLMQLLAGMKKEPPRQIEEETKVFVTAKKIEYGKIAPTITEGGRLGSQNKVDVISEVQGQILKGDILLKKGQRFRKGAILARIYDGEASNNLMAAKSRFLNTLANALPDLKIDYPESHQNWLNFFQQINIRKNMPELPEIKNGTEKTFLASRNILNEYYLIKSSEIRLAKYNIRAPFNGSFIEVFYEVGSTVNPGSRLGRIIQTDKLELEVPVKVADINWLNIGDEAKVIVGSSQNIKGKITRIADFVSPETQSVSVFIGLKPDKKVPLFEGMYLTAVFQGRTLDNVAEMPRNAVFNKHMVYLVEDSVLVSRAIDIHKINEKTLIFSGLPEGAELVVEPLINAHDGMKVEILK